ncbi:MAG TPA: hypothetical protein VN776_11385 [Terracidiphilus sp.]|nr:hypothetical protein [Terracidiphilus sp.]
MAVLDGVKNAFINKLLEHVLDGNKGSNILGIIITGILAQHIDYTKAIAGFQFTNADNAAESAKLIGTVVVAVFAYFVGKKKTAVPA